MAPFKRKKKRPAGRILRVKEGYNPNSSSMGSIIFVLPALLLAISTLFGLTVGFFTPLLLRRVDKSLKQSPINEIVNGTMPEANSETNPETNSEANPESTPEKENRPKA